MKIIRFLMVCALVAVLFKEGLPWLQRVLDTGDQSLSSRLGSIGTSSCVGTTDRARDEVGSTIARFSRPPIDTDGWSDSRDSLDRMLDDARLECDCSLDSCRTATTALDQLGDMVDELDGAMGSGQPPLNLARSLERVDTLISRARGQERQGS